MTARTRPARAPAPLALLCAWDAAARAALAGSASGTALVAALRTAMLDDPHFPERAARAAHAGPAPAARALLDALRADPAHPDWGGMLVSLLSQPPVRPDLAGPLAAGEATALAAALAGLPSGWIGNAAARFVRVAGHHAAALLPPGGPPTRPLPPPGLASPAWTPAGEPLPRPSPFAWTALQTGHLAMTNLLVDEVPEAVEARATDPRDPEWRKFAAAAGVGGAVAVNGSAHAYLLRPPGGGAPFAGLVAGFAADPAHGILRIDLAGPFATSRAPGDAAAPYLAHLAATAVLDALRGWDRHLPPGGRLRVLVSPEPHAGGDPFPQDLVDAIADTFAQAESQHPAHGFDLLATRATRDGRPVAAPALHRTRCPPAHRPAWERLATALGTTRMAFAETLAVRRVGDRLRLVALDGASVPSRAVPAALRAPAGQEALAAVLAEAGFGEDAILLVGEGYLAVAAAAAWDRVPEPDGPEIVADIALVVPDPAPGSGDWERMRAAFWREHHDRYEALLAAREARADAGPSAPSTLH